MRGIKFGFAAAAFAVMGLLLVSCEKGDVKTPATGGYGASQAPKQSEAPATGGYGAQTPKQAEAPATGGYGK